MRLLLLLLVSFAFSANAQMFGSGEKFTNSITVNGEYNLKVQPDVGYVDITVYGKAANQADAKRKADELLREVKRVAKSLDIHEKHIKSNYVSLSPMYEYTNNKQKLIGYESNYSLQITVEKLVDVGLLTERLVAAGIDRINNVHYGVKDDEAGRLLAMQKAFANAKLKAKAIADAAGVTLGKPIYISENGGGVATPVPMMAYGRAGVAEMSMDKSAESPPKGEMNVNSNIYVIFAIE
jgi:uncharacterized protein YggE